MKSMIYGYVIDVLDFHVYEYLWPAFNINDSAIMCGVVMIMFYEFFKRLEYQRLEKVNSD